MTRAPFVRAVVLNWNGGDHVVRSVAALLATDWPVDRLAVVVVDNASTDGSDRLVESTFPSVELRRSPSNVGFPGNNLAMTDLVGVDYVALVNNDAFVTPSWLAPLVDALEADSSLGAASPKLVFAPRFTEVALTCATVRRPLDGRDLGVRLSGLEVAGVDRWTLAQFGSGFWGEEAGSRGGEERFRWTAGVARLGVPLWEGPEAPPVTVLRLSARPVVIDLLVRAAGHAHAPAAALVLIDQNDAVFLALVDRAGRAGRDAGRIEAMLAQPRQIHHEGVFELAVDLLLHALEIVVLRALGEFAAEDLLPVRAPFDLLHALAGDQRARARGRRRPASPAPFADARSRR